MSFCKYMKKGQVKHLEYSLTASHYNKSRYPFFNLILLFLVNKIYILKNEKIILKTKKANSNELAFLFSTGGETRTLTPRGTRS